MICNAELCPNYFSVGVSVPAVVFHRQFWKTDNFGWNCWFFEDCRRNTIASKETFTENLLRRNFTLHFTSYLSIALSKILPHLKTIKNAKKLSVFGENDSCHLSNFLQIQIFWNFYHTSRICNQIYYRNIWFPKVIIILIMTAKVLCLNIFSEKNLHLNAVENPPPPKKQATSHKNWNKSTIDFTHQPFTAILITIYVYAVDTFF